MLFLFVFIDNFDEAQTFCFFQRQVQRIAFWFCKRRLYYWNGLLNFDMPSISLMMMNLMKYKFKRMDRFISKGKEERIR
jgi:hypothetical protein